MVFSDLFSSLLWTKLGEFFSLILISLHCIYFLAQLGLCKFLVVFNPVSVARVTCHIECTKYVLWVCIIGLVIFLSWYVIVLFLNMWQICGGNLMKLIGKWESGNVLSITNQWGSTILFHVDQLDQLKLEILTSHEGLNVLLTSEWRSCGSIHKCSALLTVGCHSERRLVSSVGDFWVLVTWLCSLLLIFHASLSMMKLLDRKKWVLEQVNDISAFASDWLYYSRELKVRISCIILIPGFGLHYFEL